MKACEKWWESLEFPSKVTDGKILRAYDYYDHMAPHNIAQDVWRAALIRVIRWGMRHYGNDFLCMDLYMDIRKELDGKDI